MGAQQGLPSPTSHYYRREEIGLQHLELKIQVRESWGWKALEAPLSIETQGSNGCWLTHGHLQGKKHPNTLYGP